jgi:hypothetical protein
MTNRLNVLERQAIRGEDAAYSARWEQAEEIVRRLEEETEREIAETWINGRTGEPYNHVHVHRFAAAWREFGEGPTADRPPFWEAIDRVANRSSSRTERAQAQAPTRVATAKKLVENLIEKAPAEVVDEIYYGLKEHMKTEPAGRTKADKTLTQKVVRHVFGLWKFQDELQDSVPSPEEREGLVVSLRAGAAFIQQAIAYLEGSLPSDRFEEEVARILEEAQERQS